MLAKLERLLKPKEREVTTRALRLRPSVTALVIGEADVDVGDDAVEVLGDGLCGADERRLAFGLDPAQPVHEVVVDGLGRGCVEDGRERLLRKRPTDRVSPGPSSLRYTALGCSPRATARKTLAASRC